MPNDPDDLRRKAEACRDMAGLSDSAERKALWTKRAAHWEALAVKAAERLKKKPTAARSPSIRCLLKPMAASLPCRARCQS